MKSIVRFEMKRAYISRYFVGALVVGLSIAIAQFVFSVLPASHLLDNYLLGNGEYPRSVYNTWIEASGVPFYLSLYTLLLPILACIPYGDSLFLDKKEGYRNYVLTRVSKKNYLIAKLIATFLSAGSVVCIPLIINFYLTSFAMPLLIPESSATTFPIFSNSMWSELFYKTPLLYIGLYLIIIFMYAGLFGMLGVMLSSFVKNRFVVILLPFMVLSFLNLSISYSTLYNASPDNFLRMDQPAMADFTTIVIEYVVGMAIILTVYFYKEGKNEAN